jgi:adenosylcobinamide-GDP ribazoletransferase
MSNRLCSVSLENLREFFQEWIVPLLMALSLLTRFPVTRWLPETWADTLLGRSVLWYPVVGLLLAGILSLVVLLLPLSTSPLMVSVIVVVLWVMLTGALHLDGLADCVDAMYASHSVIDVSGDDDPSAESPKRQTVLRVLKDPAVGAMGAIALFLLLLLKVSIAASLGPQLLMGLLLALVLARVSAVLFIALTPYTPHASVSGVGAVLASYLPKSSAIGMAFLIVVMVFFLLPVSSVLIIIISQLVLFYVWRSYWMKRVGGFVGDAVGGLIELSEVSLLLCLYFLWL